MNERIKQITGQVLDELVPETWVALGYDKIKEIQNRTAELIVRECIECADIVGKSNLASGYPNSTAHHVKQKIQEHFGVE
jgi:hypothetical protein